MPQTSISTDPLLQPFQLKGLTLRNRIMSTSHACGLEEEGGMPAETYQRYHVEKARGGLALTMFGGSAYVDKDSTWSSGQLDMSTDRIVPYLQSFSERVHSEGAGIMIQITHLGRRGEPNVFHWLPTVAPSAIRETLHRSIPKTSDQHDIARIIKAFGDAAVRAQQGGLDGIETMVGGHLIGQFLSPATNQRTDEFGGSLANRCRFGLMVHEEIRRRTGDDFIVGMRFPIDESMDGGLSFEDCVLAAKQFEESGLIDFFNANYGQLDTEIKLITDCMPGMASPIAPWLKVAGEFKREMALPVFHAARITDLATARYAIKEGLLDMVAMTRAHIADPNIVNKIQAGAEDRIRPCVGMTHCMGSSRPTCAHNVASGRDQHWPQNIERAAEPNKKIIIVGGGPAGLEAARICGARGHNVILMEASDEIGGQLRMATKAKWRNDISGVIDWRRNELAHYGVDIRMNCLAEVDDILQENPDIVINATGGIPDLDWLKGNEHCDSTWDILSGNSPVKESVLIYDGTGRHTALTAADFCNNVGAKIALVLIDDLPGAELNYGERVIWRRELAKQSITPLLDLRLVSVDKNGASLIANFVHELTGELISKSAHQIIIECGTLPVEDVFETLRPHSNNDGVTDIVRFLKGEPQPKVTGKSGFALYRIGDAVSSRNMPAAMFDALRLCSVM